MLILYKSYHKYGGKHLVLVLIFLLYTAIGAVIFLLIEEPVQYELISKWIMVRTKLSRMFPKEL